MRPLPALAGPGRAPGASVLGVRGQAARHIRLINANPSVELQHVYHPDPEKAEIAALTELPVTGDLDVCFESDAIIVSSPTSAHFAQLEALAEYPGYILLEKPAVESQADIDRVMKFSEDRKSRIKVNFNFQFNPVAQILAACLSDQLIGDLIHASFETNHGGAFKDDWRGNWRMTDRLSGPIYTVGIHYVQWLVSQIGNPARITVQASSFAGNEADDSGIARLAWDNRFVADVLTSYASAYKVNFQITGTDGYLAYDGLNVNRYSPRDTFGENGYFVRPPETRLLEMSWSAAYDASVQNSQNDFWVHVQAGSAYDPREFDRDVEIMSMLIGGSA